MPKSAKTFFVHHLLQWNSNVNDRQMPWKGEQNPYFIWLSEIILQQTRVEQGLAYYEKFIHHYPDVQSLAKASDTKVMKLWEGLGYYSRCRNLIKAARLVNEVHHGVFPIQYEQLLKLPGIGPYTAAAISSFSSNAPFAVVDGNVFRVLSRFFGINKPVDETDGKKVFTELAQELLPNGNSAVYNQAIMDFGATVCKPANPKCEECVLNKQCFAFLYNEVNSLPIKMKKLIKKNRYFHFVLIRYKGKVLLEKRLQKDIWQGLYQFPLVETTTSVKPRTFNKLLTDGSLKPIPVNATVYTQALTHQNIHARFYYVQCTTKPILNNGIWVSEKAMNEYPMPKIVLQFLKNHHSD